MAFEPYSAAIGAVAGLLSNIGTWYWMARREKHVQAAAKLAGLQAAIEAEARVTNQQRLLRVLYEEKLKDMETRALAAQGDPAALRDWVDRELRELADSDPARRQAPEPPAVS